MEGRRAGRLLSGRAGKFFKFAMKRRHKGTR